MEEGREMGRNEWIKEGMNEGRKGGRNAAAPFLSTERPNRIAKA